MAVGEVYAEGRRRVCDLVVALPAGEADRPVLTCPEWTVGDVLAHVVGVCADILAGDLAGVATDPWTAAQVRARKGRSLAELVEEWSDVGPRVEAFADHFPAPSGPQWVADLTTHEHDIRAAVDQPGARESRGVHVGLEFLVTVGLHSAILGRRLPPLGIRAGERSWQVGPGAPARGEPGIGGTTDTELNAPPFDLFRALTGRRSADQVRQLDWRGDPEPYLPAFQFGPFTVSSTDIGE